ncbi:hypothetical protein IU405_05505, partial [Polaribacter sp. BAL334]|uniref:hypothetical protein n=1 Tax=Polaribacter sp. BAL334 TaxID=1708178 RepID=UPI0018D1FB6D
VLKEKNKIYDFDKSYYNFAGIEVRSKNYSELYEKEYVRLKSSLKPEDVLDVKFKEAYIKIDKNGLEKGFSFDVEKITYKSTFLDKKIIEFKGVLTISDSFNKILSVDENFLYTFKEPLEPLNMYELFGITDPNLLKFNWDKDSTQEYNAEYNEIKKIIFSGRKLKISLIPKAIVLENGEVIK